MTVKDGCIATIEGKENIKIHDLPIFHNILFVNDSKDEWNIYNCAAKWIMKGIRTSNNSYGISAFTTLGCHKATLDDLDLWYQRLGQINFRDLSKISKKKVVQGLPNMQTVKTMVWGAC